MADVTLTSSMRANLLTLQNTQTLFDKTSERLATGKEVNSVLDDAVKFFTADALNQRASLLEERKSDIGNAVQSVTAATNGIEAIKTSIQQLKSLVSQARSALGSANEATILGSIATQYTEVVTQVDYLGQDASYNGVNFLRVDENGDPTSQTVFFNEESSTSLTITGFDASSDALDLTGAYTPTFTSAAGAVQTVQLSATDSVSVAPTTDVSTLKLGGYTITFGSGGTATTVVEDSSGSTVASISAAGSALIQSADGYLNISETAGVTTVKYTQDAAGTIDAAGELTITQSATAADYTVNVAVYDGTSASQTYTLETNALNAGSTNFSTNPAISTFYSSGVIAASSLDSVEELNAIDTRLNAALATLQSESSKLSGNVGILQTRDNFLKELSNTLTTGADKLTLADLNEEGANLLALQTQQQLGITSLSLASQAQQGVLRLF